MLEYASSVSIWVRGAHICLNMLVRCVYGLVGPPYVRICKLCGFRGWWGPIMLEYVSYVCIWVNGAHMC